MNKIIAASVVFLVSLSAYCQDITGEWNGTLSVQGVKLRLVFHISRSVSGLEATMDSPDQGAKGLPVKTVSYSAPTLKLALPNLGIEYEGILGQDGVIDGTFKQGGMSFPLKLSKEKVVLKRPQEPSKPYPYIEEEVVFTNKKAGIKLAGTLTIPSKTGVYPAVVLISGSGAQNRDEELMGHKPFLVVADYLTRRGIAVLRYDDRGTAASGGDFSKATSADFADDAEAALDYLKTRKEVITDRIGFAGHSEGGIIAPIIAARRPKDVGFIILLAGTGVRGDSLLLLQSETILKVSGTDDENIRSAQNLNRKIYRMVAQGVDSAAIRKEIAKSMAGTGQSEGATATIIESQISRLSTPWFRYFIKYDPVPTLTKVKCPVLVMNGEKDVQVPAGINTKAIEKALKQGGNNQVTVKLFPRLNHLFQECQTGLPDEYSSIEQTFAPEALETMSKWIETLSKK